MKHLIIGILSSFTLYSCTENCDCAFTETFFLTNNTENNIKIQIYQNGKINFNYNLESKQENLKIDKLSSSDSAKIIYNNKKKKIFYSEKGIFNDEKYNILFSPSYKVVEKGKRKYDYIYTITEEDYNLAEDCNGNCEE